VNKGAGHMGALSQEVLSLPLPACLPRVFRGVSNAILWFELVGFVPV
jgi:hypothetical protein